MGFECIGKHYNQAHLFVKSAPSCYFNQGNITQGKAQVALKNWKTLFGDQREDSLSSLEVCYSIK